MCLKDQTFQLRVVRVFLKLITDEPRDQVYLFSRILQKTSVNTFPHFEVLKRFSRYVEVFLSRGEKPSEGEGEFIAAEGDTPNNL